jgi:hypothetical protein
VDNDFVISIQIEFLFVEKYFSVRTNLFYEDENRTDLIFSSSRKLFFTFKVYKC